MIPESGRSPGKRNGYPLQYSCLENPMDRGACWATVHGVTKSWRVGHDRGTITSHSDQVEKHLLCSRTESTIKNIFLDCKKALLMRHDTSGGDDSFIHSSNRYSFSNVFEPGDVMGAGAHGKADFRELAILEGFNGDIFSSQRNLIPSVLMMRPCWLTHSRAHRPCTL